MRKHLERRAVTVIEAGEMLKASPAAVRRMIHQGRLTAVKLGRPGSRCHWRVPLDALPAGKGQAA